MGSNPRSEFRGCVNFGPSAVSPAEGPDFRAAPGQVTRSATHLRPQGPSGVGRIVRQSAWHGTRHRGSGCCCPHPFLHGPAAQCGQARSPRGQSRRRRSRGIEVLPLIDAGAAPSPGDLAVVRSTQGTSKLYMLPDLTSLGASAALEIPIKVLVRS